MKESQMATVSKFKAYQVVTGFSEAELNMKVTTLIAEGGWQLYAPPNMCAMPSDSVCFMQALLLFEVVNTETETQQ